MKPVDIVLATYKPNITYLGKLLKSLNTQTYPNINLIVRDDSEDNEEYEKIKTLIRETITSFNCKIFKNDKNLGSNKTFEKLTQDSMGEYIAYCDQDDIWEDEKIEKLVNRLEKENSILCYSDLSIIDKNDRLIANSFKKIHKRLKHLQGEGLFEFILRRNCVTGCTMLIKSEIARLAIPFCNDYFVHDHWLTLFASSQGKISYIKEPLVRYRIHDNNQIGASMLNGINSREDYLNKKLFKEKKKYKYLIDNYTFNEYQKLQISKVYIFTNRRIDFFQHKNFKNIIWIISIISYDWQLIVLEVIINCMPKRVVEFILEKIKK